MSGVLDAFFVEIGLDPTKYRQGAQEITDADKRVRELLLKSGNEIEGQGKKTGESILGVRNSVLSLFAAFTGVGATAFVTQMVHADAATGRSAKTLNMSTRELGAWETAAQLAGAKAGELTSGVSGLTQALETATLTGDASLGAKFRQLFNIDIMDEATGKLKTATQIYLELAGKMEGMDPAKAATAANILGVPAGVIPLLLQGRAEVEKMLDVARKIGQATDEDAAAAIRFENAWTKAFKAIQAAARPLYGIGTAIANQVAASFDPKNQKLLEQIKDKETEVGQLWWKKNVISYKEYTAPHAKASKELEDLKAEFDRRLAAVAEKPSDTIKQVGVGESPKSLPAGGAFNSQQEKEAFIRAEATKRGIDANVAVAVAKSEGFYNYGGDPDATGKKTSFGAFQLHYPGVGRNTADGLGTAFTKKTGLDARDPATEREQIKFALDEAAKGGWTPWHGWRGPSNAGLVGAKPVDERAQNPSDLSEQLRLLGQERLRGLPSGGAGVGAGAARTAPGTTTSQSTSKTDVQIGAINVYPPNGDADSIGKSLGPAIKRDLFTQQGNDGPQ